VNQTIRADSSSIYGFHSEQFETYGGMDSFITSIKQLRESGKSYKWAADQVYDSLVGENSTLEKSDIKIIGAIVTGKPQQLIALQGKSIIKASTFGVLSDKIDIKN
jgi:hypothetical protein